MTAVFKLPAPRYDIEGLDSMESLPDVAPLSVWQTGFADWLGKIYLAPQTVSIVTGLPGMGKTMLFAQIWFQVVAKYNLVATIATFETRAKPHYRRLLRQFWGRCLERELEGEALREADEFINDHYRWITHPEETPSLDYILDRAEASVARDGTRIVQIDPWNRVESQRGKDETESEYIAWCLRRMSVFAKDMDCHVQIIAHPAKRDHASRARVPDLEDVSGAMHWFNMPDQGFVVHRKKLWDDKTKTRCFDAELYHRKARHKELGYPCVVDVRLDPTCDRFESAA